MRMRKIPLSMSWPLDESLYKIILCLLKFCGVGGGRFFRKHKNPGAMPVLQIPAGSLGKGHYIVSVLSMSGDVLQTEDVQMENKGEELRLPLKDMEAGTYLIHVFNRNTAASYTEELVVH